ncbi:MAG: hypothetical protein ACREUQ_08365 [Burkholderiales bacterium]
MVAFIVAGTITGAAADDDVRKLSTEPRSSAVTGPANAPARLDFDYGDIRAWLLADGNWHIEGIVRHRGALCDEYQLGIQFGAGSPGCANVEWFGRPSYVTSQVQCNNALLRHSGGDLDPLAAQNFDRISCAQRLIRCLGNCK